MEVNKNKAFPMALDGSTASKLILVPLLSLLITYDLVPKTNLNSLLLTRVDAAPVQNSSQQVVDATVNRDESVVETRTLSPLKYLTRYGYLQEDQFSSSNAMAEDAFEDAVREFQRFSSLNVTGKLDASTLKLMNMNRCGNRDLDRAEFIDKNRGTFADFSGNEYESRQGGLSRRKRYALLGSRWPHKLVTYRVSNYSTSGKVKQSEIDGEIDTAFRVWSRMALVKFEKKLVGKVDIEIKFVKGPHDGCEESMDEGTNILAHAYAPGRAGLAGDVHFNDYHNWASKETKGERILAVAIHEIGHSIGLSHSHIRDAIMYPINQGTISLHKDDTKAIQTLYGGKSVKSAKLTDSLSEGEPLFSDRPTRPKCGSRGNYFFKGPTCKQFYDCTSGYARLKLCPAGLLWSQSEEMCNFPHKVPECNE